MPELATPADLLSPLAALAPLGISPFLALGLFGAASHYGGLILPPGVAFIAHPALWGALLALALLLGLGRSSKLTRPLAELVGTTESLTALLAFAGMFLTAPAGGGEAAGGPAEAGVLTTVLLVAAATTGLAAVIVVRMGVDLLVWLSPVPLIDAGLELVKLTASAVLVAVAVLAPAVAVVLNLLVLVAAAFVARRLFRIARFAVAVIRDALVPAAVPPALERSLRSGDEEVVGPLVAWVTSGGLGVPRLTPAPLSWRTDVGWVLEGDRHGGGRVPLGAGADVVLTRGWFGSTLTGPGGRVFLTRRSHAELEALARRTGAGLSRGLRPPRTAPSRPAPSPAPPPP